MKYLKKIHHKTSFDGFMKKPSLQYRPLSANPNHATQENEYPKDIGAIYDDHNGAAPRTPSIRPFAANPEKKIGVPH